jgi:hypothetical protein
MLSAEEHVALLAPYLDEDEDDPDVEALRRVQQAVRDGVLALLQVAMAGGRLGERAREVVLAYVAAEVEAARCEPAPAWAVELWLDNLAPTPDIVVAAVDRLLAKKDRFARLLPWLLKAARCQASFDEQEEAVRGLIAEVRQHYRRKLFERPKTFRATR